MKFTNDPEDISVTGEHDRELVAHRAESTDAVGVSVVSPGGSQVAVVWLTKQALASWAMNIVSEYGEEA